MLKKLKNKYLPKIIIILLALSSFYSWSYFSQSSLDFHLQNKQRKDHPPLASLQRPIIDFILLGQKQLYDDFVLLWTVQYLVNPDLLSVSPEELEIILMRMAKLKIRSPNFYQISCYLFIMKLNTPWLCEDIAKEGIKNAPEDWIIPAILGLVYLKQEEFISAATFFTFASNIEGSPKYFKTVGATLLHKKGVALMDKVSKEVLQEIMDDQSSKLLVKQLQEALSNKKTTVAREKFFKADPVLPYAPTDNKKDADSIENDYINSY